MKNLIKYDNIHWLSEDDYAKAVGQLKLQISGVFAPFGMYGMKDFIPPAVDEVVRLCEDFGLRVRGINKAISLEMIRRNR